MNQTPARAGKDVSYRRKGRFKPLDYTREESADVLPVFTDNPLKGANGGQSVHNVSTP
jgi:hypothetical protein